jgi:DNA-binding NtrC family response regulator
MPRELESLVQFSVEQRACTVMVVDDDATMRHVVGRILRKRGFEVIEADGAKSAHALAAEAGAIDLLVTDVVMPEVDGHALGSQLRLTWPDLPVIYMSGYSADALAKYELQEVPHFLCKPFTPQSLLEIVDRALANAPAPTPAGC